MKHFTISSDNNITIYPTRKAAKETGLPVFSNEVQLADLIGSDAKRLVEIHNSIPGTKPVARFSNRKAGCERIWTAIQGLAGPVVAELVQEPHTDAPVQTPFDEIEPTASAASEPPTEVVAPEQPSTTPAETSAPVSEQVPDVAPAVPESSTKTTRAKKAPKAPKEAKIAKPEGVREGSKTATVIALMQRDGGATLTEVMLATGWQAHSCRGFVSGTLGKKMGLAVNSTKGADGERRYSILAADAICK